MRRADRLVTVSQSARAQLGQIFRRRISSIEVITEGPAPCFVRLNVEESAAVVLNRYRLPAGVPLILYVGGISPHKNLERLLRAAERVNQSYHVVLVGDYSNDSFFSSYNEVAELSRKLGMVERVTFTGYVPDPDLVVLYNMATMLVLPSLGEGFGLPAVEAMACGLPIAASNRGSLPEVIGEAGLLFDPCSEEEIAGAIARLLGDESLRRELGRKAQERAKLFSWKNGADKMMSILEGAARAG
jgi:glycosyltransferase involved in cell wall biosynthesis